MKIIKIPKRNGKFRTIYVPNEHERELSAVYCNSIAESARLVDEYKVQHGFTKDRNCITNSMVHAGFIYTVSFDLADFFDTVTPENSNLPVDSGMFYDGAARQGLPSSPAVANLAASQLDNDIMSMQHKGRIGVNFVYTRYADDMTFSTNHFHVVKMLVDKIPAMVSKYGFKINPDKTHVQCATAGRRIITGVAVDTGIHPTRKTKRKLRAALHQMDHGIRKRNLAHLIQRRKEITRKGGSISISLLHKLRAAGLAEWAKLKLPKNYKDSNHTTQVMLHPQNATIPNTIPSIVVSLFGKRTRRIKV